MKILCNGCFELKQDNEFHKSKRNKNGFSYSCKLCESNRYKNKKSKNPEAHNLKSKLWARKRKENDPDYGKNYYHKNKQRIIEYKKNNAHKYKDKKNARTRLNLYILRGYIVKPKKCSACLKENDKIEGHHEDYLKPLEVIWLCHPCHVIADKEKKKRDDMIKYDMIKNSMYSGCTLEEPFL